MAPTRRPRPSVETLAPKSQADALPVAPDVLFSEVRDALVHLHDPAHLQVHPLARLIEPAADSRSDTLGRTLRRSLLEAIEALRPGDSAPLDSDAWSSYNVLSLRHVEGLTIEQIERKLSISQSEYYRIYRRTLRAVASLFEGRWGLAASVGWTGAATSPTSADQASPVPLRGLPGPPPSNLPVPLTSFVGREREMEQIRGLLATTRLLTLTGAGGGGKTRLALRVASDLQGTAGYPDGIWLAELAGLAEPSLVPQAVALALGLREQPGQPIVASLIGFLKPRRCLLVLDNCEHLLDACARLVEGLVQACADLRVLATSREVLRVQGEVVWRVPSLAVPDPKEGSTVERISRCEAVQLFAERVRLVRPGFALDELNAPTVALICRCLDGLPLAIELAAARARGLGLEQIAARLDDRFHLLTGGSRAALSRHQTLRGTLDWSHSMLTQSERVLFRRLAVFVGGWSLEAAEGICAGEASDGELESTEVVDYLLRLVDRSLVLADETRGEARYRMLETVRQYGLEQLADSGEEGSVRDRHCDWYLSFAEAAEPEHYGPDAGQVLERLDAETGNLRAAHRWCLEAQPESALRLAYSMLPYWDRRGRYSEARAWLGEALAKSSSRTALRGWALANMGRFVAISEGNAELAESLVREGVEICREVGDAKSTSLALSAAGDVACYWIGGDRGAVALYEESLSWARRDGDKAVIAWVLLRLGAAVRDLGEGDRARELFEESLAISRSTGDRVSAGNALRGLGRTLAGQGRYHESRQLLEESIGSLREIGDWMGAAWAHHWLGEVLRCQGDYDQARAALSESLRLFEPSGGHAVYVAHLRWALALVALLEGNIEEARSLLTESIAAAAEHSRPQLGLWLWSFGMLASQMGDRAEAARLLAAASAHGLSSLARAYLYPADRAAAETALASARSSLGEEAFARAWAEGQAMTLEQAVEYALQDEE